MGGTTFDPIHLPDEAWRTPEIEQALRERDFRSIFQLARKYGVTHERITVNSGVAAGRISEVKNGHRIIKSLDVMERIAGGLNMPDHARVKLGLAPREYKESPSADGQSDDAMKRTCASCGYPLSRYNPEQLCQACGRSVGEPKAEPERTPRKMEKNSQALPASTYVFAEELRRLMEKRGISGNKLTELIHCDKSYISKVLNGHRRPSPQVVRRIDEALDAKGRLIDLAITKRRGGIGGQANRHSRRRRMSGGHEWPTLSATDTHGASHIDEGYVQSIRESGQHLVALDGLYGGDAIFPIASKVFRAAQRKLGAASLNSKVQHDLEAATGEMGQVAAWLAYDADKQADCRQIIHEALLVSRLAGDRNTELFVLDHLVMQSLHVWRPREALQILDNVAVEAKLPPRVSALFEIRRGRALAQYGDAERAFYMLGKARSSLADSINARDPQWTWWIDEAELIWHKAMAHADLGDWRQAVPLFREAADLRIRNRRGHVRYRRAAYNDAVHFLNSLVRVEAWEDAENVLIDDIMPNVAEVNSRRTTNLLLDVLGRIEDSRNVGSILEDAAYDMRSILEP